MTPLRPSPYCSLLLGHMFSADRMAHTAAEPGGATARQRAKILIVEDNLLLALNLEDALAEADFDVVGKAVSADQAVEFAQRYSPALVIMDIRLEGARDGIDAATEIYERFGVRAIFASSASARDFPDRVQAANPLGWLIKPYDMDDLILAVRGALAPKAAQPS